MTMREIMCGASDYPGLIPTVRAYLDVIKCDSHTLSVVDRYLRFIEARATGEILTEAMWFRKFVSLHAAYKQDSVLTQEIVFDLMAAVHLVAESQLKAPQLLGSWGGPSVTAWPGPSSSAATSVPTATPATATSSSGGANSSANSSANGSANTSTTTTTMNGANGTARIPSTTPHVSKSYDEAVELKGARVLDLDNGQACREFCQSLHRVSGTSPFTRQFCPPLTDPK